MGLAVPECPEVQRPLGEQEMLLEQGASKLWVGTVWLCPTVARKFQAPQQWAVQVAEAMQPSRESAGLQ